ncbi:hypothetical protein LSAT2_032214 [Lamellibrachia satsuma]|nr:hypothetical protein LSAT2_032214 [Lamellibrachia satsuma]
MPEPPFQNDKDGSAMLHVIAPCCPPVHFRLLGRPSVNGRSLSRIVVQVDCGGEESLTTCSNGKVTQLAIRPYQLQDSENVCSLSTKNR